MTDTEVIDLSDRINSQLPAALVSFMRRAGEVAQRRGLKLYLVGGVVRDLLLGRTNLDLDLVVEGDAIDLAQELMPADVRITTHARFGTARLRWNGWSVDLATARSETYARPGALPSVKPGLINDDLFRRDFTINAMAVEINPGDYGRLLDPYRGRDDLESKLVRVLHEKSFIDDATRIWRGLRYEQRLDFELEPDTLDLLKRNIAMLDTISGDRIRHELELVLKEEFPEKMLRRADELGVLARLHPALSGDGWLAAKFEQARQLSSPDLPSAGLYLALQAYRMNDKEGEQLLSYLRLPKPIAQTIGDTISLKSNLQMLGNPRLSPSRVYSLLHGYSPTAITANLLVTDSSAINEHIQLFLSKLRYIKPVLTGNDVQKMGVTPGPRIKEILNLLREARLDGKVTTKKGEEGLVEGWLIKTE